MVCTVSMAVVTFIAGILPSLLRQIANILLSELLLGVRISTGCQNYYLVSELLLGVQNKQEPKTVKRRRFQ